VSIPFFDTRIGRTADAVALMERIIAEQPDQARWWRQLASIYLMLEDVPKGAAGLAIASIVEELEFNDASNLAKLFSMLGMPADGVMVPAEAANLAARSQSIVGSKMGSSTIANDIPHLIDEYRAGRLKLDELVSGEFALEDINQAIDGARTGTALRNVIVF